MKKEDKLYNLYHKSLVVGLSWEEKDELLKLLKDKKILNRIIKELKTDEIKEII